jgi:hypothetical protein
MESSEYSPRSWDLFSCAMQTRSLAFLLISGDYINYGVMRVIAISRQVKIQSQEVGIGRGRQFASMCRTTIVRIAPAVIVIAEMISIARLA